MSTEQADVRELENYWNRVEQKKSIAGAMIDYFPLERMPPWDEICRKLDWELHLVDGDPFREKDHGYCGVYRLIALASEGNVNKPATLSRVAGQDTRGTLYIGESAFLHRQLNELRRSFGSEYAHNAIDMLLSIPLLKSKYPSNKLGLALLPTGINMNKHVEKDLIRAYMNSFGDTPPLNYRL